MPACGDSQLYLVSEWGVKTFFFSFVAYSCSRQSLIKSGLAPRRTLLFIMIVMSEINVWRGELRASGEAQNMHCCSTNEFPLQCHWDEDEYTWILCGNGIVYHFINHKVFGVTVRGLEVAKTVLLLSVVVKSQSKRWRLCYSSMPFQTWADCLHTILAYYLIKYWDML